MAAKTKTRRRGGVNAPIIAYERKKEVLGLVLMMGAFLLFLALISYNPADDLLVKSFNLAETMNPDNNRATNALGLFGASIAYAFIPNLLGYPIILWTVLLFAWGYLFLRNRPSLFLPMITTLTLMGTFQLSCLFGWFGVTLGYNSSLWSGGLGYSIADWLIHIFGTPGSFFLLCLSILITTMLIVDRDIQRSIDRVEDAVLGLRDAFVDGFKIFKHEITDGREGRLSRLRERRLKLKSQDKLEELEETGKRKVVRESSNGASAPPAPSPSSPPTSPQYASRNDFFRQGGMTPPPPPNPEQAIYGNEAGFQAFPPDPAPPPPHTPQAPPPPQPATPPTVELKIQQRVEEEKIKKLSQDTDQVLKDVKYQYPPVNLLDESNGDVAIDFSELEENKRVLLDKLLTYNIQITDINAIVGPTITLYELTPAPGVKISKITALEDDLAMAMAARGIRMVAPIPGKSAIGVEIPNRHRELVRLRDLIATKKFSESRMNLPFPAGKTIEGQAYMLDISKMPHLLIAGATGAGKSVCLNTLITGLMYACHPSKLKFVMIDPKKIELQQYSRVVNHYLAMPEEAEMPIITDVTQAMGTLKSCEKEMERRYDLLSKAMVRGISEYNEKYRKGELPQSDGHRALPYIVVVVDELADLMLTAGKEIEGPIARLAQMARAVGIHLVLATQRPSVDVITGLIKANFPARIAFQVASKIDSRTILDQNGAEGLVGNGDMLFMKGSQMIRLQGPFVSVDEVDQVTKFIGSQRGFGPYMLPAIEEDDEVNMTVSSGSDSFDDLFEDAARIIVRSQQGSVSLLQRKLSIGYTRSARIVDQLEKAGIVGPFEGSKARKVLVPDELVLDEVLKEVI